jgi:peptidoglycan/xylan/chitin deacetylase (PgdA/CDA1 family)
LSATHDIVPLAALNSAPIGPRPRAVLTFDDAYRGAVTVGVTEIVKRRLPATIFVAPGILGTATWWDRLADATTGDVSPTLRDTVLSSHRGLAREAFAEFGPGSVSLPPWAEIAADHEVRTAAAEPGITVGAHTWNHPNLTTLGADDLATELSRPLAWLRGLGDNVLPWLAYPYGLTSPSVADAARRAGYIGAFRVDGGWMRSSPPPPSQQFDLPRMNVPSGLSLNGFRLKVSGF